ncbi:MAG: glycogen/starch/alpha-glucan family phosphorylase, partial [Erysipelotrichia bacterium]|nr:glycogen/starch/alpha-glucan family phosphorylase [Erysipelotrichia bacterium]
MELENQFTQVLGKPVADASRKELYAGLLTLVKQKMAAIPETEGNKKLYYISAEFLTGKQLGKNLINLGIYDEMTEIFRKNGKELSRIEDAEAEPSLGNGGLGRLAACFLDSIATLNLAGDGIGLRYHFGLFKQEFVSNKQHEVPDDWMDNPCWLEKTDVTFPIELAGKTYHSRMYNLDIIGHRGGHNQLHLFDLDTIDESIVHDGIEFDKTDIAKNLTLFLYPDDSDKNGQLLRIYQQYFMVSNAAQMIIRDEKEKGHDLHHLDDYIAIQINDTHPSMIIPELVRLLIKEGISMREAANIVTNVCAYTNHTILAEALEKWPMEYLNEVVPQLMPIIGGLDYAVVCAYNNNENLNIISRDGRVHMARIDMHYGHSINGVAALHTEILKYQELRPFFDIYPEKFNNKTNGITFRRWLMHCNHPLSNYIDQLIGEVWKSDADHLQDLMQYYNNNDVLNHLDEIKHANKVQLAEFIKAKQDIDINPDSIFDVQVKRMHEYKRQQMNALWIIYEY